MKILSHVSYPGLAAIVHERAGVIAAQGHLGRFTVEEVCAHATLPDELADSGHHLHRYKLPAGYVLVVALPSHVVLRLDHLARATKLLERMLSTVSTPDPDPGSGAPALVDRDDVGRVRGSD